MKYLLVSLLFLTSCAGKHYSLCVVSPAGGGCSHTQFDKKTAGQVARMFGTSPAISDNLEVWVLDNKKKADPVPPVTLTPSPTDGGPGKGKI